MAARRMISIAIITGDEFLDMSFQAQALYFQLLGAADDDGFVSNPKGVMRLSNTDSSALDELVDAKFIIRFESGVVLITHWKAQNIIPKDRYKPSVLAEKALVTYGKDGIYHLKNEPCIQNVYIGKDSIGQDSIGKVSLGKISEGENTEPDGSSHSLSPPEKIDEYSVYGTMQNVKLTDKELETLKEKIPDTYLDLIEELSLYLAKKGKDSYKNHLATILSWARRAEKEREEKARSDAAKTAPPAEHNTILKELEKYGY